MDIHFWEWNSDLQEYQNKLTHKVHSSALDLGKVERVEFNEDGDVDIFGKKKYKDVYEYINSLEKDMDVEVKEICEKYDITFNHSGGGCIHLGIQFAEESYFLINPYDDDVAYEFDNFTKDTHCIFGVDDMEGNYFNFQATFIEGVELIAYLKEGK